MIIILLCMGWYLFNLLDIFCKTLYKNIIYNQKLLWTVRLIHFVQTTGEMKFETNSRIMSRESNKIEGRDSKWVNIVRLEKNNPPPLDSSTLSCSPGSIMTPFLSIRQPLRRSSILWTGTSLMDWRTYYAVTFQLNDT